MTLTIYFLISLVTSLAVYTTLYLLNKNSEFDLKEPEVHLAIVILSLLWIIFVPIVILVHTSKFVHKLVYKWQAK